MPTPPPELAGSDPLGLIARSDPLRELLSQEMHLRRLPRFAAPARLLQVVFRLDEAGLAASSAQVAALRSRDGTPLPANARHALFTLGSLHVVWERHAEFATYGFLLAENFPDAFDVTAFAAARTVIAGLPDAVIRATLVALLPAGQEGLAAQLAEATSVTMVWSLAISPVARRVSGRTSGEGLGRLLIVDRGLAGDEPHSSSKGCRNSATTATWRCSACQSPSARHRSLLGWNSALRH